MSAIGAPGGAAPPAAPGPAGSAPGAPAAAPAAQPQDRFGFAAHLAGAPDHLRPMLQQAFDQVTPGLTQQLDRYAPIEPHFDRIAPLLQAGDDGAVPLVGLANLYELFNNPEGVGPDGTSNLDALADWFDAVGETFGFFDDEEGGTPGAPAATAAAASGELNLDAIQDPGMRAIVEQLKTQNDALQARLGEFEGNLQQSTKQQQLDTAAQKISTDLKAEMKKLGLEGHDDLNSPNALDIMRFAISYGEDPQAIQKAAADFARMTGKTPATPVNPQLDGAAALQAALGGAPAAAAARPTPGPSLGPGQPNGEPEPVKGWEDARSLALQRMTAQQ